MTNRSFISRTATGLATACLLLPLAACGEGRPPPSAPGTAGSPAALERYYRQSVRWEGCDGYANTAFEAAVFGLTPALQCARVEVPLDYRQPEGRTLQIALLRRPARGERIGSLVMNPGGPGGSGLFAGAATAMALAESPLTERFDLVSFDPRGVGSSLPAVDCYADADADRGTPLGSQGTTVQWTEKQTRALVARCAAGSGGAEMLAAIGTRDVAHDLDVLRTVLGDDKLTFLGQSYGTRLGAVYAEQYPRNVRAMLLDGAIDPYQGTLERRVAAYAGFQRAFDRMAASCAKEQDDCPLGTDPAQATQAFSQLVRPLRADPVPALDHQLDFDNAIGAVIAGLYDPAGWPRIIKGLDQIRHGRGDELLQMGYDFSLRDAEGRWPNFLEANYAINCMDEDRLTDREGGQLRTATYAAAPFMDPGVDVTGGARDTCEHWPAEPTLGFPYADDVQGLPTTLVVSIIGDPTTPHAGAVRLAEALGSRLLTVEGEGHTVVTAGQNDCVNDFAAAYLIDLELPGEGANCGSS